MSRPPYPPPPPPVLLIIFIILAIVDRCEGFPRNGYFPTVQIQNGALRGADCGGMEKSEGKGMEREGRGEGTRKEDQHKKDRRKMRRMERQTGKFCQEVNSGSMTDNRKRKSVFRQAKDEREENDSEHSDVSGEWPQESKSSKPPRQSSAAQQKSRKVCVDERSAFFPSV
eukprot:768813-Hanusia_phi.AAC.3